MCELKHRSQSMQQSFVDDTILINQRFECNERPYSISNRQGVTERCFAGTFMHEY